MREKRKDSNLRPTALQPILLPSCHHLWIESHVPYTLVSHLLTGTKFSDFATFVFSMPCSARSCHISFHSVKYYAHVLSILKYS